MSDDTDEVSACLELLDGLERKFLDMDRDLDGRGVDRDAVHSLFRNAHNLKGALALRGDAAATSLVHGIETSLDAMRSGRLRPTRELVDAFLSAADRLRSLLAADAGTSGEDGGLDSCRGLVEAIERAGAAAEAAATEDGPAESVSAAAGFALSPDEESACRAELAGGARIFVAEKLLDGTLSPEKLADLPVFESIRAVGRIIATRPAFERVERGRESALSILFASALTEEDLLFVVFDPFRELKLRIPEGGKRPGEGEAVRRDLRVDTAKLDKLFDLVGELITAEAMLAAIPELAGQKNPRFAKSFGALAKITRDLQETAMAVMMTPLESLFDRMARLVRDLSRKVGKRVELVASGEDTEMDKNAIELIADPLVHIIRNAVDHGIESPEARRSAGKDEVGRISIGAQYEGSDILVSVSDDGAGLDRDAILRKAIDRGLVEGDGGDLDEAQIRNLIFLPGFSTSAEVSDISGRGVGLDVVKRNLEKLRGGVEVSWKPGMGTTFILRVPLTLAIIDAIGVRAGGCSYSIPVADIREFFKPGGEAALGAGFDVIALRDEFLPLIRLEEALGPLASGAPSPPRARTLDGVAIVVSRGGKKACLLIDEVVGAQQVVVKPLPDYLGKVEGLSGCSVNGDGSVSFIVDSSRLMARCPC